MNEEALDSVRAAARHAMTLATHALATHDVPSYLAESFGAAALLGLLPPHEGHEAALALRAAALEVVRQVSWEAFAGDEGDGAQPLDLAAALRRQAARTPHPCHHCGDEPSRFIAMDGQPPWYNADGSRGNDGQWLCQVCEVEYHEAEHERAYQDACYDGRNHARCALCGRDHEHTHEEV